MERALDTAQIVWGMLFGAIGAGYMVYGKRQRAIVPLACGLALMVFPYFVSSSWAMVVVGIVLMAIPYFIRL
ncbi:MAG: hypothetical protein ABI588_04075 [Arenimonas sp.]